MDDMLHHTQAVVRGSERAMVVTDLPFMTYQVSVEEAMRNAGRLLQEGGCQAVKLEGGVHMAETVRRIVQVGIPGRRPHRPDAAVDQPAQRLQGAGQARRRRRSV